MSDACEKGFRKRFAAPRGAPPYFPTMPREQRGWTHAGYRAGWKDALLEAAEAAESEIRDFDPIVDGHFRMLRRAIADWLRACAEEEKGDD